MNEPQQKCLLTYDSSKNCTSYKDKDMCKKQQDFQRNICLFGTFTQSCTNYAHDKSSLGACCESNKLVDMITCTIQFPKDESKKTSCFDKARVNNQQCIALLINNNK